VGLACDDRPGAIATTGSTTAPSIDEPSRRIAHLALTSRNSFGMRPEPLQISVQFVAYSGLEEAQVRHALDLWEPPEHLAAGECALETVGGAEPQASPRIELLSAGPMYAEQAAVVVALEPRPLPLVFPDLTGVTYGTEPGQLSSEGTSTGPDDTYSDRRVLVVSTGELEIQPFEVSLQLPAPVIVDFVNDRLVGSSTELDVDLERGLLVFWNRIERDVPVFVDIESADPSAIARIRCRADDGVFSLPGTALERLRARVGSTPLRVSVRRVNQTPLELDGFEQTHALAATEHVLLLY